jgi:hypothetical protein
MTCRKRGRLVWELWVVICHVSKACPYLGVWHVSFITLFHFVLFSYLTWQSRFLLSNWPCQFRSRVALQHTLKYHHTSSLLSNIMVLHAFFDTCFGESPSAPTVLWETTLSESVIPAWALRRHLVRSGNLRPIFDSRSLHPILTEYGISDFSAGGTPLHFKEFL